MNLNNLHERAGRKYEKHLSIFGRKVLRELVQQNVKDDLTNHRNSFRSIIRQYSSTESSNFRHFNPNDFPLANTETTVHENTVINYIASKECLNPDNRVDLTVTNNVSFQTPAVPQSNDLVTCVCEDAWPQIAQQNLPLDSLYGNVVSAPPVSSSSLHLLDNKASDNAESWDDMFDSKLLSDIKRTENDALRSNVETSKLFKIKSRNNQVENKKTYGTKILKKRTHPNNEELAKKVKRNPVDSLMVKSNFRKQTYRRSVKKWLNDVDPANPVDAEIPSDVNVTADEVTAPNEENPLKVILEKSTAESKSKRTVQAQLSNQNGIMKYCKPKLTKTADVDKLDTVTETAINEERNVQCKFVPPMKSQIPVKEVTYEIAIIGHDCAGLFELNGEEIIVTLIYGDGVCQLNSRHSKDVEAAQGVMVLANNKYYHIPNSLSNYRNELETLMNKNSCVCYEGKHVITHLVKQFGISIDICNSKFFDVKVGGSLLDPDNPPNNFPEVLNLVGYVPEFTPETECASQKTAWHMMLLQGCWRRLRQALLDQGLWKVFEDIEMRVLPIISEMERVGVCVNMEKLKDMEMVLMTRMRAVEAACHGAAGRVFRPLSAPQVRALLYDELRLDSHTNVTIRETICKGAKSTSETMLRSLMDKHPLPKLILEYRHLHKAHSTFLLGIAQCVRDGVVTPVWEQSAAATGRIACNTPNLQAVPKAPFSLTLFPENARREEEAFNLRSVYESRAGWRLVAADFRQVECRVLALAAGDAALADALRHPDLFTVLAAAWLGKEQEAVSGEERERTKRVVYASMYGAGANKLADVLGLGYERALEVAASFNRTFPSLKSFGRDVVARCERDGTLRTPCGRARHFENIASPLAADRAQAERRAVNFIIQGSAADVCKTAMVSCVRALAARSPPLRARLLLQIHDELVWEVRHEDLHEAAAVIQRAMEGCGRLCGLAAALPVALRCGPSWGHMEEFTPQFTL